MDAKRPAGPQFVHWNGTTDDGRRVTMGFYYSRLTVDGRSVARMLTPIR